MSEPERCPDDGGCHHECTGPCWRVDNAGPLSAANFEGDAWPAWIVEANALLHDVEMGKQLLRGELMMKEKKRLRGPQPDEYVWMETLETTAKMLHKGSDYHGHLWFFPPVQILARYYNVEEFELCAKCWPLDLSDDTLVLVETNTGQVHDPEAIGTHGMRGHRGMGKPLLTYHWVKGNVTICEECWT